MSIRALILILGLIVLSDPCVSRAQQQLSPPDSTDLHASYCIAYLKQKIGLGNMLISREQPPASGAAPEAPSLKAAREKALASATDAVDAATATLKKIQLYLLPRMMYLEPMGLLGAATAAKDDIARAKQTVASCSAECTTGDPKCLKACYSEKMPDLPDVQKKWTSCNEPSWLPF